MPYGKWMSGIAAAIETCERLSLMSHYLPHLHQVYTWNFTNPHSKRVTIFISTSFSYVSWLWRQNTYNQQTYFADFLLQNVSWWNRVWGWIIFNWIRIGYRGRLFWKRNKASHSRNVRCSQQWLWTILSSKMWCCVEIYFLLWQTALIPWWMM